MARFLKFKKEKRYFKISMTSRTYRTAVSVDRPQCYRLVSIAGNAKYKQNNFRISFLI